MTDIITMTLNVLKCGYLLLLDALFVPPPPPKENFFLFHSSAVPSPFLTSQKFSQYAVLRLPVGCFKGC